MFYGKEMVVYEDLKSTHKHEEKSSAMRLRSKFLSPFKTKCIQEYEARYAGHAESK